MNNCQIAISDTVSGYYLDEVTCYERPVAVTLNYYKNRLGSLYLILCKAARAYCLDDNTEFIEIQSYITKFIQDYLGISVHEENTETDIIVKIKSHLQEGHPVLVSGNLLEIPYSTKYKNTSWEHLFIIKGYNPETEMFTILDNTHLDETEYKDKNRKLFNFYLTEDIIRKAYKSFIDTFGYYKSLLYYRENENLGKYTEKEILCNIIQRLLGKKGVNFSQILKINELVSLYAEESDQEKLTLYIQKLLNINKYKNVMLDELILYMIRFDYPKDRIDEMKELKKLLFNAWSEFVSLAIIKLKRNRYQFNENMLKEINKYENSLENQLILFQTYLTEHEDYSKKRFNTYEEKENLDNIISVREDDTCFEFDNGKTYNIWNFGNAPKRTLLSKETDRNYKISANIVIDAKTKETAYQTGIFIKNSEEKMWLAAIDSRGKFVVDLVGISNLDAPINLEVIYRMNIIVAVIKNKLVAKLINDENNEQLAEITTVFDRTPSLEMGLLVKTWGNGEYLKVNYLNNNISIIED